MNFADEKAKLSFASDYMKGAHPAIMKRLVETNMMETGGYGLDPFSDSARDKIRMACEAPRARVEFLVGGTQTNATVIDALLRSHQGVVAAHTGHIATHEAGAIEAGGHKVLTVPHKNGKIDPETVRVFLEDYYNDDNHEHMVMPGMVYISHPTEYGTLYSRKELQELHEICRQYRIPLYLDGARLAYALACPANDISLPDLAACCDVFYIGGTKCGALLGEAVVVPDPELIPGFFSIIKQHGALLAKGRILGIQFDTLFTDGLYEKIGAPAIAAADKIRTNMEKIDFRLCFDSPTNQIFCILDNEKLQKLGENVEYSFWEKYDEANTIIRLATDWSITPEKTDALIEILENL